MNVNQNINKLLYALSIKGQFYKIGSNKCYSDFKQKYVNLHYVYKFDRDKNKYIYEETFFNKIEIMKYLADELKEGGANETN